MPTGGSSAPNTFAAASSGDAGAAAGVVVCFTCWTVRPNAWGLDWRLAGVISARWERAHRVSIRATIVAILIVNQPGNAMPDPARSPLDRTAVTELQY